MDTVQEENSSFNHQESEQRNLNCLAIEPQIRPHLMDDEMHNSLPTSRRSSAIIAAHRRPSQAMALSAANVLINQRRYLSNLLNTNGNSQRSVFENGKEDDGFNDELRINRQQGNDALTTILSAFYAKLLVVLGMAFPITEILSKEVTSSFYQAFYLYLYIGSISFLIIIYTTVAREKAVHSLLNSFQNNNSKLENNVMRSKSNHSKRYGSFYLRLGAIAFGIGSMVYSGLEFVRYFEARNFSNCNANVLHAIIPATRTILTLLQMQFIFLSSKDLELRKIKILARFGLMHMIATDLCEWLYVLVEETKHEMIHLAEHHNDTETLIHEKFCQEELLMGSLVTNASPFLFPCTIEYSLICAVILFEMWKKIRVFKPKSKKGNGRNKKNNSSQKDESVVYLFNQLGGNPVNSENHFTVDCSSAHRGLFAGIMVVVLTIISLITFFVLTREPGKSEDSKRRRIMAQFEVNAVELVLYVITTLATIVAMVHMRALKYERKVGVGGQAGIGLDNTLLVVAQAGVFIYSMFSIIGDSFTTKETVPTGLLAEIFSFVQTSFQTIFVLDSWWRRVRNVEQSKKKPGRELITFLIVANMALWTINSLEKNKAEFSPDQLLFFGDWAWTIITHISMPLAIFYRFHSTICLFEIWKNAYKLKSAVKLPTITVNQ